MGSPVETAPDPQQMIDHGTAACIRAFLRSMSIEPGEVAEIPGDIFPAIDPKETPLSEIRDITLLLDYIRFLCVSIIDTKKAKEHRTKLRDRGFSMFDFMNRKALADFQRIGGMFSFREMFETLYGDVFLVNDESD